MPPEGAGVDRPGTTRTFRLPNVWAIIGAVITLAMAAFFAVFPAEGLFTPGYFKGSSPGSTAGDLLVAFILIFCSGWLGIRLLRIRAQVSGQQLMIRNTLRTYAIDADRIRAITVKEHSSGEGTAHWFPWVELTSGRGVWIDGIDCGRAEKPPRPERLAVVEEIRARLGLKSDDLFAKGRIGNDGDVRA